MTMILSTLLTVALLVGGSDAAPLSRRNKLLTLPLTRIHQARDDIHPEIASKFTVSRPPHLTVIQFLQQHINRGHRRLARMTGVSVPSDEEMAQDLRRRMIDILEDEHVIAKRYTPLKMPDQTTASGGTLSLHAGHDDDDDEECVEDHEDADEDCEDSEETDTAGNPGFSDVEVAAITNGVTEGKAPTFNNSLALDILGNDVGYTATFEIGTPPRAFRLLMDSGSADMWIPLDGCVSEGESCGNHTFISEQKSSSFNLTDETWDITYGSGSASGFLVSDDVHIGGITLTGHQFGVATNESSDFSGDGAKFDGLVGLALSTLSNQGFLTPVEAMAEGGFIDEAITSYKISRASDELFDGEITFGGLDESKFDTTTLVTVDNLDGSGFWSATLEGVNVDGTDLGVGNRSTILDTGTTLLIMPFDDATAIHDAIEGAASDGTGAFFVPCTTNASIALSFGGTSFDIFPGDLPFFPVTQDLTGLCQSGIVGSDIVGDDTWLVGDVFLKSVYFSTNANTNQISLAKLI